MFGPPASPSSGLAGPRVCRAAQRPPAGVRPRAQPGVSTRSSTRRQAVYRGVLQDIRQDQRDYLSRASKILQTGV